MLVALDFGVTKLISWRWGSAWESVADILRLEALLRNAFDIEKYLEASAGNMQDDGAESDKQAKQVAQAISDPLFWCEALKIAVFVQFLCKTKASRDSQHSFPQTLVSLSQHASS